MACADVDILPEELRKIKLTQAQTPDKKRVSGDQHRYFADMRSAGTFLLQRCRLGLHVLRPAFADFCFFGNLDVRYTCPGFLSLSFGPGASVTLIESVNAYASKPVLSI